MAMIHKNGQVKIGFCLITSIIILFHIKQWAVDIYNLITYIKTAISLVMYYFQYKRL